MNSYRSIGTNLHLHLQWPSEFRQRPYNVIDACSPRAFGIERAWEMARGQTPAATFALVRRPFIQRLYSISFFNA